MENTAILDKHEFLFKRETPKEMNVHIPPVVNLKNRAKSEVLEAFGFSQEDMDKILSSNKFELK